MTPYYERAGVTLYHGDCLEVMEGLGPASFHAIVTDPPYGVGMAAWDGDVAFRPETWRPSLPLLRPGGWLMAFGATRTYHRLAGAIEGAGFEIRDSLAWLHGGGSPPSRVSLKPAWEPVVKARRPLDGTLAASIEAHGCGGLGIDDCRVPCEKPRWNIVQAGGSQYRPRSKGCEGGKCDGTTLKPRWPANVAHDGSAGVVAAIGHAAEFYFCSKSRHAARRGEGNAHPTVKPVPLMEWLVKLACPEGGMLLEPFAGSGTTLVAAANSGRRAVGVEMNEAYCDIAARRLDALVDKVPLFTPQGSPSP